MAVIALTSASGSPGVTTTALGLALQWPRPVLLVEADPTGGSGILAGFFRGVREYEAGLVEIALSSAGVAAGLAEVARPLEGSQVSYVAGTRSHVQASGLRDVWSPLVEALADLESAGQDVVVDAGRLGLSGSPTPLFAAADLTLLVTRTTLPALAAARSWTDALRSDQLQWAYPGLLVVEGQPGYRPKTVTQALHLPVVASIAQDRESAAVYHRGASPPRRFATSAFARSLRAAVESIHAHIAANRAFSDGVSS